MAEELTSTRQSASQLQLSFEVSYSSIARGLFAKAALDQGRRMARSVEWVTEDYDLSRLAGLEVLHLGHDGDGDGLATVVVEGCLARVQLSSGNVSAEMAGEPAQIERAEAALKALLPESSPAPNEVSIRFWWLTEHGARSRRRLVEVANWAEVEDNYPVSGRRSLQDLMALDDPAHSGRLMLWHGPPGTGKTWCLRALAKEWEPWCDFHYIADPERFFGKAEYMIEVLLDGADLRSRSRWRLLVLEDTGELLAADAKERSGQGLSRFLNTVDGLIGQGLKTLILVTTNEEISTLHPAVVRSGRCRSVVHFTRFPVDEAAAWLARHGRAAAGPRGPVTLSDLYAASRGHTPSPPQRATSFVPQAARA